MKLPILLLLASTTFAAAQDKQNASNPPHTIGPVTIVKALFDYHQAIRFDDGVEKEFYHCEMVGSLSTEGRRVYITFIGDGTGMSRDQCAIGVSVRPATSKSRGNN